MHDESAPGLRIDRWLWFVRFYKTRTLAAQAVAAGHVRLNGERARGGNRVKPGDSVSLVKDRLPYELRVMALPLRRGPAAAASACYEEGEAAKRERQRLRELLRSDRLQMPRTPGRPDKHTRRKLRERNRQS